MKRKKKRVKNNMSGLLKRTIKDSGYFINKLCEEIAPKYEGRVGGYTQILKLDDISVWADAKVPLPSGYGIAKAKPLFKKTSQS